MQSYLCIHLIDYTLLEGLADLRYMYVAKNSSFLIFCISNRGSSGVIKIVASSYLESGHASDTESQ